MDFVDNEIKSEFVFNNPNAKGTCGCGESFHVWIYYFIIYIIFIFYYYLFILILGVLGFWGDLKNCQ